MAKSNTKKWIGLSIAAAVILPSLFLPLPAGLTRAGLESLALLFAGIVLWFCGSLPEGLSCMLLVALAGVMKIESTGTLFYKFGSSTFFFILAMFAVAAALERTTIPIRVVNTILRVTRKSSRYLVLGFITGSALLAAVMSSHVACCALFAKLADSIIRGKEGEGKSPYPNLAKCLMLSVSYGAGIGGFATPTSTAANLLAVDILHTTVGITVRYVDWLLVALPICLISLAVCWLGLVHVFPPEEIPPAALQAQLARAEEIGPLKTGDKRLVAVVCTMLVLWILSSWLPAINTLVVAIFGMIFLFLPNIGMLEWKDFSREANWNTIFFIGGVSALIFCITSSGASEWLVSLLTRPLGGLSPFVICLAAALSAWLLHAIIPMSSGIMTMLAIPFIGIAQASGVNPAYLLIIISYWAGFAILLPFDAVVMLAYRYGYYTIGDMLKSSVVPSVVINLSLAVLVPLLAGVCLR